MTSTVASLMLCVVLGLLMRHDSVVSGAASLHQESELDDENDSYFLSEELEEWEDDSFLGDFESRDLRGRGGGRSSSRSRSRSSSYSYYGSRGSGDSMSNRESIVLLLILSGALSLLACGACYCEREKLKREYCSRCFKEKKESSVKKVQVEKRQGSPQIEYVYEMPPTALQLPDRLYIVMEKKGTKHEQAIAQAKESELALINTTDQMPASKDITGSDQLMQQPVFHGNPSMPIND
mmetsp:Transcript_802/g.1211  ORF Transcript_802/g.1211 Transcript_802/m.1211 type:complete len:237 (+) Transcript_802:34-744(+)